MELRNKFWWFVGITLGASCLIVSGLAAFSWQQLSAKEQARWSQMLKTEKDVFIAVD